MDLKCRVVIFYFIHNFLLFTSEGIVVHSSSNPSHVAYASAYSSTFTAVKDLWEECSLSCGGGFQRKIGKKTETRMCNLFECPGEVVFLKRNSFE